MYLLCGDLNEFDKLFLLDITHCHRQVGITGEEISMKIALPNAPVIQL